MSENVEQQLAKKRRMLHERIVERADRFNAEVQQAAQVVEMMKHPGWEVFVNEIKKLEQQFANADILLLKSMEDVHVRQGATIVTRLIQAMPEDFAAKAKQEMLDEAKAVALYGDLVADEVANLSVESSSVDEQGSIEPTNSNLT